MGTDTDMTDMSTNHFPACYVELPHETEGRRAAFYLAAEEYIAETLPADSYFMTWQLGPTVVMGRNQAIGQEVDLDFCHREGIDVIRRRSGGGAIFADERNIMTSLITEAEAVEPLFREYAEAVASALRQLGAPAVVAGRNDIILSPSPPTPNGRGEERGEKVPPIRGRDLGREAKVCGNAFYHRKDRCIAHGTMLYDTDARRMERALHPDVSKLEAKGVKSVRSRVGVLKDYLPFGVGTLRKRLRELLCDRTVLLTAEDVACIEQLEQRYYDPSYLYGSTTQADTIRKGRIEGCGTVELWFSVRDNIISDVHLRGDFFDLGQASACFRKAFIGVPLTPDDLRQAIREHQPERSIRGLCQEALMRLLLT